LGRASSSSSRGAASAWSPRRKYRGRAAASAAGGLLLLERLDVLHERDAILLGNHLAPGRHQGRSALRGCAVGDDVEVVLARVAVLELAFREVPRRRVERLADRAVAETLRAVAGGAVLREDLRALRGVGRLDLGLEVVRGAGDRSRGEHQDESECK